MHRSLLVVVCVGAACGPLPGVPDAGPEPVAGGAGGGSAVVDSGVMRSDGGVDAGVVARSDAGCRLMNFSQGRLLEAHYLLSMSEPPLHYGAVGLPSASSGIDALGVEFWWQGNQVAATIPYRATLARTSFSACNLCVTVGEGCSAPTRCQKTFLAQSGTVQVLKADRSVDAGALVIEGQRLSFREWSRASDTEVQGGECLELASFSIAGTWLGAGIDAGVGPLDAGTGPDLCLAATPLSTLGCNGGFRSGNPAPNTHSGSCMTDNGMPQGTCTSSELVCNAGSGTNIGRCIQYCPASSSYISTGGCNQGYRCVKVQSSFGVCFRDCDSTHPCPSDQRCDSEGSCVDN